MYYTPLAPEKQETLSKAADSVDYSPSLRLGESYSIGSPTYKSVFCLVPSISRKLPCYSSTFMGCSSIASPRIRCPFSSLIGRRCPVPQKYTPILTVYSPAGISGGNSNWYSSLTVFPAIQLEVGQPRRPPCRNSLSVCAQMRSSCPTTWMRDKGAYEKFWVRDKRPNGTLENQSSSSLRV